MKGNVFDIKKFAVHDGPGIRSTLFLKGCPLNCLWCHNPEGINYKVNLWFFDRKCIQCRSCIEACPQNALREDKKGNPFIKIDRNLCDLCGKCVEVCPTTALSFDGYEMEADEAVEKLLQDRVFYERSGGGITISGGDPLYQHEFSREVLRLCHEKGIHTAIETSMQAQKEILESFFGFVDLFIVDIKIMDSRIHHQYIGSANELILSNFKFLIENKQNILVRIPLIPDITTTEENLRTISQFVVENSPDTAIELINFNPLAENKYRLMGKDYEFLNKMKPYSQKELDVFYSFLKDEGVRIKRETEVS